MGDDMEIEPRFQLLGWNEYQWSYVSITAGPLKAFNDFAKAKYHWEARNDVVPQESDLVDAVLDSLMCLAATLPIGPQADRNIVALDAAHQKATTTAPKPNYGPSHYSDGGMGMFSAALVMSAIN